MADNSPDRKSVSYGVGRAMLVAMLWTCPGHVPAAGVLSADEVAALVSGMTVTGERREGMGTGFGKNMVSTFADAMVLHFDATGSVSGRIADRDVQGSWWVNGKGELCLQWDGDRKRCGPVHREGDSYLQTLRNKQGRVKFQYTFREFAG